MNNMNKFITAERSTGKADYFYPTFIQHQKVYSFCTKFCKNKKVLDLGCGVGEGSKLLATTATSVLAIDYSKSTIHQARQSNTQPNLEYQYQDIRYPTIDRQFDVIVSLQVIEHLDDLSGYFNTLLNWLKPQGLLIISTPNALTQSFNENPFHVKEFSAFELKALLTKYFKKIKLYGLFPIGPANQFEQARAKSVQSIMKRDKFKLRMLIPTSLKKLLFSLLASIARRRILTSSYLSITLNDYKLSSRTTGALDLIAVCSNPHA